VYLVASPGIYGVRESGKKNSTIVEILYLFDCIIPDGSIFDVILDNSANISVFGVLIW
jgi:hypothetical protein